MFKLVQIWQIWFALKMFPTQTNTSQNFIILSSKFYVKISRKIHSSLLLAVLVVQTAPIMANHQTA